MGIQHDSYWEEEEQAISEFLAVECKCGLDAGKSCSRQFGRDVYIQVRGDCSELSHDELDVCIISQLSACVSDSSETACSTLRKFSYAGLRHRGKHVCMKTVMFMHGIGGWLMRALKATMLECGIVQRVHGNTKRLPHNTLSFDGTQRVVAFITFYAEEHAILLPGRVPGYKRADVQLLPTHTTKKNVWRQYCAAGNGDGGVVLHFLSALESAASAHPHHQADGRPFLGLPEECHGSDEECKPIRSSQVTGYL